MKILHVSNHYPPHSRGSYERQCALIVQELGRRGHRQRVLTSGDGSGTPAPARPGEVAVERVLRPGPLAGETHEPFLPLWLRERHNRNCLQKHLDEFGPEVVVVWGARGLPGSLRWQLAAARRPVVYVVFDYWLRDLDVEDPWLRWWRRPLPFNQRVIRYLLRKSGLRERIWARHPARPPQEAPPAPAVFGSRSLRDLTARKGYPVADCPVIPPCVAPGAVVARTRPPTEIRRLLFVARLQEDRDPLTAIRAIHELRARGAVQFSLDLYGAGEPAYEEHLRAFARSSQLGGAVGFRPYHPDQLDGVFPLYDAFLFTGRTPETFPIMVVRAMAARVPVISTCEGGSADVIRDGENALVYRTGDHVELANRIQQLAGDPALAVRLTDQAARDVRERFTIDLTVGRLEQVLQAAVAR